MTAPECIVVGCGSSAYAIQDVTPNREWASLHGDVRVCNVHKDELAKPETEWILTRDQGKQQLFVGDSLRNLNEYILLGIDGITGYGSGREFSHREEDGNHLNLRVRRRGDREKEMVLVVPSMEIAKELKDWVGYLSPDD